jgi:hypothetical protein
VCGICGDFGLWASCFGFVSPDVVSSRQLEIKVSGDKYVHNFMLGPNIVSQAEGCYLAKAFIFLARWQIP